MTPLAAPVELVSCDEVMTRGVNSIHVSMAGNCYHLLPQKFCCTPGRGVKRGAPDSSVPVFPVEPDAEVESIDHGERL